ncbi:hypothetical protein RND71_000084 [Anisodus tanguticus]|uniref:Uncharacterized protein n=1 Tax=Anisodus tanguticus TaxID=243964 RepID=A0AAE1SY21_9SOLA|nr:hypothetical protein RND71_000084 [Anisodus tanguticus]
MPDEAIEYLKSLKMQLQHVFIHISNKVGSTKDPPDIAYGHYPSCHSFSRKRNNSSISLFPLLNTFLLFR